jgi:hypothetical protein
MKLPALLPLQPLCPESFDQGDPFVLEVPAPAGREFRYFVYCTSASDEDGPLVFHLYASPDFEVWKPLGRVLKVDAAAEYWAPAVYFLPESDPPFVMLYSRSLGKGAYAHAGHRIYRAVSERPEGPFETIAPLTPESLDFAIDPDVFRDRSGTLQLTFATDFLEGGRIGTGLAEAAISEDLSELLEVPRVLHRAHYDWQVFDARRSMPWKEIPEVIWERGDTVVWHCIEGPTTFYSPDRRRITLYSGGSFQRDYGVGILAEDERGHLVDRSSDADSCFLATRPDLCLFGPGHGSLATAPYGTRYYVFHARFGTSTARRQMTKARIAWDGQGVPYCPDLPRERHHRDSGEQAAPR